MGRASAGETPATVARPFSSGNAITWRCRATALASADLRTRDPSRGVKAYDRRSTGTCWCRLRSRGTRRSRRTRRRGFPGSLSQVAVLLPTAHAGVRARLDVWL